jgi:survival-of-motor-neuron-related-splicing factor 30
VIEQISEHGLHIRYKKYNDKEVVSFDSVRITPEQKLINEKKKKEFLKKRLPDNELEFSIPDNLKINPSDSEAQRQMKKKKIKALKNNFKQKQIEKETKEKQDVWLNFNQKNSKLKSGFFAHKKQDSIFKSPTTLESKVGVINAGKGGELNKKI